jgi:hypothetical protein
MATAIKDLVEYESAAAEYAAALQTAAAGNDEVAKLRAELAWERKQGELRQLVQLREEEARDRESTIARIKAEYPNAAASVWSLIPDLTQMEAAAKTMHESIENAKPPQRNWAAEPGARPARQRPDPSRDPDYQRDLRERVNVNKPGAVKEFVSQELNDKIFSKVFGTTTTGKQP